MDIPGTQKQRWVVYGVDPLTIASLKVLATSSGYSTGHVLDLVVEYFGKKIRFEADRPLKWSLPDDF
jgi:hypothetical protein